MQIFGLCVVDAYTSAYMLIAGLCRLLPQYPHHAPGFFLWMQARGPTRLGFRPKSQLFCGISCGPH